jgi:alkylated DNA repair dioxygenase AlkB
MTEMNNDTHFMDMKMEDATVMYCENFLQHPDMWYFLVDNSVEWTTFKVRVFGKIHDQPRQSFYQANDGHPYKYSGVDRKPEKWSTPVDEMIKEIEEAMSSLRPSHPSITGALGNKYRDGLDNIGAHSDDEKDLCKEAFIASISLGAERDFVFVHKRTNERRVINLKSGSLLLMGPGTQDNWKHSIPVRKRCTDPRINITFRSVIPRV